MKLNLVRQHLLVSMEVVAERLGVLDEAVELAANEPETQIPPFSQPGTRLLFGVEERPKSGPGRRPIVQMCRAEHLLQDPFGRVFLRRDNHGARLDDFIPISFPEFPRVHGMTRFVSSLLGFLAVRIPTVAFTVAFTVSVVILLGKLPVFVPDQEPAVWLAVVVVPFLVLGPIGVPLQEDPVTLAVVVIGNGHRVSSGVPFQDRAVAGIALRTFQVGTPRVFAQVLRAAIRALECAPGGIVTREALGRLASRRAIGLSGRATANELARQDQCEDDCWEGMVHWVSVSFRVFAGGRGRLSSETRCSEGVDFLNRRLPLL